MRVDMEALRKRIADNVMTQQEVARRIEVDKSTFSRKMQSKAETFSIGEMHRIVDVLGLSNEEAKNIFLA